MCLNEWMRKWSNVLCQIEWMDEWESEVTFSDRWNEWMNEKESDFFKRNAQSYVGN